MGLLINIIKSIVASLSDDSKSQGQKTSQPVQKQNVEPQRNDEEWQTYFRYILKTEFPQYTVRENVPVPEVAGYANDQFQLYVDRPKQAYNSEWGQPYTFVLEQTGTIKGVVMLGKGHCHKNKVKYLISRMYAKKMNIPYIYFYTQFPNKKDYVVERIRKFLN